MPYKKRTSGKYNKYQKKAYTAKKKRNAKSYRNRQQRLSILTVKAIAKEACAENVEVKRFVVNDTTGIVGYYLGHPSLNVPGETWGAGQLAQYTGRPYCKKIFDNSTITQGIGASHRIGDQIFIKGFWLRYKFKQPLNMGHKKIGMGWYKVTMMIVRALKGIRPKLTEFVENYADDPVLKKKLNPNPRLNIIAKKVITFRPRVTAYTSISPPIPVYKPVTLPIPAQGNNPAVPAMDAVLQFPVQPVATGIQPTIVTSTQKTITGSWYVKINKKINCFTTTTSATNVNPYKYWVIIYSLQPNLTMSTTDKLYTNNVEASAVHGYGRFNVQGNHKVTVLYTDS